MSKLDPYYSIMQNVVIEISLSPPLTYTLPLQTSKTLPSFTLAYTKSVAKLAACKDTNRFKCKIKLFSMQLVKNIYPLMSNTLYYFVSL